MEMAFHHRRRSLLPQPRALSSYSDQEELLARQEDYVYSISSRKSLCSSIPSRPVPPTQRRMMSPSEVPTTSQVRHNRRRSGIPRLASGSSRRPISIESVADPPESPFSGQSSIIDKSTQPPSSWRTSQVSTQSHLEKPSSQHRQDLPGVKQQLQIRHYSTQSLSSPSEIGSPPQLSSTKALPKSATTASLVLPHSRDVTPRRRLMKPLSPPLPKSYSTAGVSCFNSPAATPSPTKNDRPASQALATPKAGQVDVVGALNESRMSDEEIELLNQVKKEAAVDQQQLKNGFSARHHKQKPFTTSAASSTAFTKRSDTATITLSFNDVANTTRLEEQRSSASSSRPLFINSTLANAYSSCSNLLTPNTVNSAASSGPDDEWEANLRLVHFAEPPAYWAGRYMTTSSRLRQEEINEPRATSPSSAGSTEKTIEPSDVRRMHTALKELRSCCRTSRALESFDAFEAQLKKSLSLPVPTRPPTVDSTKYLGNGDEIKMLRAPKQRQQALSLSLQTHTAGPAPSLVTPAKLDHPLPNIWSRLALPKSKTTSNLFNLQSASNPRLPTPTSHRPKPGEWLSPQQARRTSGSHSTSGRKSEVLKDVRQLVKTPSRIVQQRMSSAPRTPSYGSGVSMRSENRPLVTSRTMPHLREASTTTPIARAPQAAGLNDFDKLSANLTYAALETGHAPPPLPRYKTPGTVVNMENDEKVLKSRRRSQRKSSGEIIKGVFDAGVKQVKQMGKRVGGSMSWVGSQEDLSINVLVPGTR